MKEALLIPVRFIIIVLILLLVFSLFVVFSQWAIAAGSGDMLGSKYLPQAILGAITFSFIPALFVTVLILLFRILRNPEKRRVSLLLIGVLSFISLYIILPNLAKTQTSVGPGMPSVACQLQTELIYDLDGPSLYVEERNGSILKNVFIMKRGRSPYFSLHDEGVFDPIRGQVIVTELGEEYSLSEAGSSSCSILGAPPFIEDFVSDLEDFMDYFIVNPERSGLNFLTSLTLSFFFVTMWYPVRITRWPVFNIFLVLLISRAVFFLFSVVSNRTVFDFLSTSISEDFAVHFPLIILAAGGLLFLLFNALSMPLEDWKRELAHE